MVRHVHPRLENYVAELSPDDLPPLPKLTGPLSKEVRAHRSYRGMQLDGFEEAEGSKAMDYERQECVACRPCPGYGGLLGSSSLARALTRARVRPSAGSTATGS